MFDFMDSDWFTITLEVVFILLISYDVKKYMDTRKREYIVNIVLTVGFAVWTLYPMYISYFEWTSEEKKEMLIVCNEANNTKLCRCLEDSIFKGYAYEDYKSMDKNSSDYKEFLKDAKEECLDDGWF